MTLLLFAIAIILAVLFLTCALAAFGILAAHDNQPDAEVMTSATNWRYLRSQKPSHDKPGQN